MSCELWSLFIVQEGEDISAEHNDFTRASLQRLPDLSWQEGAQWLPHKLLLGKMKM